MTGCSTSISAAAKRSSGRTAKTRRSFACRRKDAARTSRRWPTRPTNPASRRRAPKPWSSAALRGETTGEALRRLSREAPARLPRRRGHRRAARAARPVRRSAPHLARERAQRRRGAAARAFEAPAAAAQDPAPDRRIRLDEGAHRGEHEARACAVRRQPRNVEVFTFGTRLTRVTRALRLKRREQALNAAAHLVSDWDGGTRIGDALQAFLAVPRFGGYARGAAVVVISDGLERGDPAATARRGRKTVAPRLARQLADAAGDDAGFRAANRGADRDPALRRRSRRRRLERGGRSRICCRLETGGRRDWHRRRPSSYLASSRSAWLIRPDAAAHLRAL